MIHEYTWRREGAQNEQKGLNDYIAVDKILKIDVADAKVVRAMFHFAMLVKI